MANVKTYDSHQHEHGHDEKHESHFKLYWGIALVLLMATVIEVALSYFMQEVWQVSGGVLAGSMMSIAIFKASLVVLFYMHLKYESRFLSVIFFIPFVLVSLLALTLFAQP
ncbi:MAG: cytochrome C oxidase subunit IV family protein [Ardenticatenaceae bacterium]